MSSCQGFFEIFIYKSSNRLGAPFSSSFSFSYVYHISLFRLLSLCSSVVSTLLPSARCVCIRSVYTVHSPGVVLHVPVTDTHNVCHFVREGGRITFSSHVPSCCSRIDSAVPWLYSYFSFPGITVGSRKSTHTYNDDDRLLRRDRFPIRPNSNRLIVPSRDGAAEASHFCFIN